MVAEEERKGGCTGRDLPAGTEVVFFLPYSCEQGFLN